MVVSWTKVVTVGRERHDKFKRHEGYRMKGSVFDLEKRGWKREVSCMVPRFLTWAFDWDVGAGDKRGKCGKESSLGGLHFLLGSLLGYPS